MDKPSGRSKCDSPDRSLPNWERGESIDSDVCNSHAGVRGRSNPGRGQVADRPKAFPARRRPAFHAQARIVTSCAVDADDPIAGAPTTATGIGGELGNPGYRCSSALSDPERSGVPQPRSCMVLLGPEAIARPIRAPFGEGGKERKGPWPTLVSQLPPIGEQTRAPRLRSGNRMGILRAGCYAAVRHPDGCTVGMAKPQRRARSGGAASWASCSIVASTGATSLFLPPRRRTATVRSSTSLRPTTRMTGTSRSECSRTL